MTRNFTSYWQINKSTSKQMFSFCKDNRFKAIKALYTNLEITLFTNFHQLFLGARAVLELGKEKFLI